MVRSFLNGRFENTAFCLLSPDGKERLSRSGRGPRMAFGGRRGPRGASGDQLQLTVDAMQKVAKSYKPKGDPNTPQLQDFHSFRQALNVASGDQRLLVFVTTGENNLDALREKLTPVMGDQQIIGKFHTDFFNSENDAKWTDTVTGARPDSAIAIIQSDRFGQQGKVLTQLAADAKPAAIKAALLAANEQFATTETRKIYSDHVAQGRREQVFFKGGMEYGEDRDGDGKIDHRGGLGRGPGGRRGGPPQRGNRPDAE